MLKKTLKKKKKIVFLIGYLDDIENTNLLFAVFFFLWDYYMFIVFSFKAFFIT